MKYCFRLVVLLLVSVGVLAGNGAAAEVSGGSTTSRTDGGGPVTDWTAQASVTHLPAADLRSIPADAGITDYRMKITRNIRLDERLTLSLGGGYGLKHIDASAQAGLPQDLHALFVETGARYRINDQAYASLRLYPGFYSDFKDLGEDDLRMPVLALGGYTFSNGISVVGGFLYRFGYHTSQYIPALGLSYQPDQYWRFDLIIPRPAVTYSASRRLQLFVAGDFASDEYELKNHSSGAKALKYSDYKAMAGISYLPEPAVKITTSVGYAFERKIAFYEANRPDLRMDDVPFFRIVLDVGW